MNGHADLIARVVHGREVAAGDEGDLVAVAVVIGSEQAARFFVLAAGVVERQPTDGPGHPAVGTAARKGFAPRADMLRAVEGGLILSDGARGGDLDLIHADDRDMGDEAASEWVFEGEGTSEGREGEGGGGAGGAAEEFSSGPERVGHDSVLTI